MGGTIDNELEEIVSVRRLRSNIYILIIEKEARSGMQISNCN